MVTRMTGRLPAWLAAAALLIGLEATTMVEARAQAPDEPRGGVTSRGPGEKRPSTRTPEDEARAKPRMPLVDECDFPAPLPPEHQARCKARGVAPNPGSDAPRRTPQDRPAR